ncbi:MAG: hypothetical protein V3V67_18750 [Myxococcota bacterium]
MRPVPLWLAAVWLLGASSSAAAELDRGELHLELSGSLRSLFTHTRQLEAHALIVDASTRKRDSGRLLERARVSLEGTYGDRISGRITYDHEFFTGSALDSLVFQLGKTVGLQTWFDADRVVSDHVDGFWRHLLYRAWVRYAGDRVEVTLGRQRIALGRGRLWNPTDLFNPIPALAIEPGQRIGQDAALVRLRLTPDLEGVGIWSPQDDPDDHRAALRLEYSAIELDAAVMAGRIGRDWVFGADFARNLLGAAVRGEATYTHLRAGGRIWQVVGSVDYTFGVGTGLYTLVEHFFNEDLVRRTDLALLVGSTSLDQLRAALTDPEVSAISRLPAIVRNKTAFQVSYELMPFLSAGLLWIHDWSGPSEAIVPSLVYSPRSDLEISLSTQLFVGSDDDSEYAGVPGILIFQINWFF